MCSVEWRMVMAGCCLFVGGVLVFVTVFLGGDADDSFGSAGGDDGPGFDFGGGDDDHDHGKFDVISIGEDPTDAERGMLEILPELLSR